MRGKVESESTLLALGFLIITLFFAYGASHFVLSDPLAPIPPVLLVAAILSLPAMAIVLFRRIQMSVRDSAELYAQKMQIESQQQGIDALREQRHDILNEITLASSYLQMGKYDQAVQCLKYMAASMSDRYNINSLPSDAWMTIIRIKRIEAERENIHFTTEIIATPPAQLNEQRLLPRLLFNLVDNAFEAAKQSENPWVKVYWGEKEGHRVLTVINNGPTIPVELQEHVFKRGISSKTGESHGWGLIICQKIANELGGLLTFSSEHNLTEFSFRLPVKFISKTVEKSVS